VDLVDAAPRWPWEDVLSAHGTTAEVLVTLHSIPRRLGFASVSAAALRAKRQLVN
jgi:hypothetical protein